MKFRLVLSAAIAALLSVTSAQASFWNYGCKGMARENAVAFDLHIFLIMPPDFAKGDITGLAKGDIFAFEYQDKDTDDWGVVPKTFTFVRGAYPDQKIVLTEKSSKVISRQNGHLGTRETTTSRYRATYHYQRLGWEQDPADADIVMDCFEKQITAP
jgi:hypothetical protein